MACASDSIWQFYQVIDEHGEYDDGDLLSAIVHAADYGADVINISAGSPHISDDEKRCDHTGSRCAISEAVDYAVKQGSTVVSAVGNEPNVDSVCCPALSESSIAVGGCLAECTASPSVDSTPPGIQSSVGRPPQSIWLTPEDSEGISNTLCSNRDCYPAGNCENNRELIEWDGNPRFLADTPDTLAPVNYPRSTTNGAIMSAGTSFATPIVSAVIGNIIEGVQGQGEKVEPDEFRRLIRITGKEIGDAPATLLDARTLANELLESKDLPKIGPAESVKPNYKRS